MNFYNTYFKLKDMELNNVNDINSTSTDLTPIDSIDVGIREEPDDELKYTFDAEKGWVPNRTPKAGEPGSSTQGRIGGFH